MPKLAPNQVPAYRKHKQSGQAIVTLGGRDFLLGAHGSAESRAEYARLTAEWQANGRAAPARNIGGLTISMVMARFWEVRPRVLPGSGWVGHGRVGQLQAGAPPPPEAVRLSA